MKLDYFNNRLVVNLVIKNPCRVRKNNCVDRKYEKIIRRLIFTLTLRKLSLNHKDNYLFFLLIFYIFITSYINFKTNLKASS